MDVITMSTYYYHQQRERTMAARIAREMQIFQNRPAARREKPTPGFARKIENDTDLGIAILVAEYDGEYEPFSSCCSINEGREIAASARRFAGRKVTFKIWAHGIEGKMAVAAKWTVGK